MEIIFEKSTEKDSETILQLLIELYSELGEERESIGFLSAELIHSMLSSGSTEIYLVKGNANVVGIFTLTESLAIYAGGKLGAIDEMYVQPDYRGKKIGEKVIGFIVETARKKGWNRIDVSAPAEAQWERTKKFYEKNGFVFTGPKYKFKL